MIVSERLVCSLVNQVEFQMILWLNRSWMNVKTTKVLSPILQPFSITIDEILIVEDCDSSLSYVESDFVSLFARELVQLNSFDG